MDLGLETDLALARMLGGSVRAAPGCRIAHTPDVPEAVGRNLLVLDAAPAPDAVAAWEATFGRELPDVRHRALAAEGGWPGAPAAYEALGLKAWGTSTLVADRVAAPAPDVACDVRPLAGDGDWDALLALHRGLRPAVVSAAWFERAMRRRLGVVRARLGGAYHGAFVGGALAAACGLVAMPADDPAQGHARYQEVVTDPGFRRRGLASHLLVTLAERVRLARPDAARLVICADVDSDAERLYQRLGFRRASRFGTLVRRDPSALAGAPG